ncbi:hypothetical protein HRI_002521500 [Hibiscus trionum]|uniref:Uncharacterized protein n=1 Tax=Hibiscus trionum TaxID=183268 RepID=A0A9W7I431_HIBTR|nr:hypothetical protein HRI_002521500 [Hibiscus trionum]
MGRIDPLDGDSVMHLALPLSLAVAATAATIAIITSVCAFWRTEPQDSEDSPETAEISSGLDADGLPATEEEEAATTPGGEDEEANEELPRPPCMRALTMTNSSATAGRCSSLMKKSASSRRISSALSVKKHFRSISVREMMDKNKLHKPEESLCKKPIMLGGKCKVGGQVVVLDDDDEYDDDTALKTQSSSQNPHAIADKDEEEEASFKPLHF